MTTFKTIGIDPGLLNLGVCTIGAYTYHYVLSPPKGKDATRALRLLKLYQGLKTIVSADTYDLAAVEGYDFKGFSLVEMAEVTGVIKLVLAEAGVPVVMVSPAAVKKFATGSSQADKIHMQKRYTLTNEHAADAQALAEIGQVYLSGVSTKRHELEVVQALKNPAKKKKAARKSVAAKMMV